MIELRNICKSYGDKKVIESLSLTLPDKGIVTITGESGIGKTTLIRLLLSLEKPDCGQIVFSGDPVFSAVFQEDRLLEHSTALENVTLVMKGPDRSSNEKKALTVLSRLGLGSESKTKTKEMSGGMKRRTAIARALCADADVCIMDEPFTGLDPENRIQTLETILEYTRDKLLIMITHEQVPGLYPDMEVRL